jgi:hypothetical protein
MRMMIYDVVTFGEAMIRFSPSHFQRLEQATLLDLYVGSRIECGRGRNPFWDEERVGKERVKVISYQ